MNALCRLEGCGHCFHYACVSRWFRASPTCPLCRVEVNPHVLHVQHMSVLDGLAGAMEAPAPLMAVGVEEEEVPNYRPRRLLLAPPRAPLGQRSAEAEARFRDALDGLEASALVAWNVKEHHERYGATVHEHKVFYERWCWAYRRSVRFARDPEGASDPANPSYVDLGAVFVDPPAPPLPPVPEWMWNRPGDRQILMRGRQ